jgi:hypothetical protein
MKSFEVTSGLIQVSDPCYSGTYEEPAKNGKWFAKVDMQDMGSWGRRIGRILVHHEGFSPGQRLDEMEILVGVDSGQMGVYDASVFGGSDDAEFYDACCKTTLTAKGHGYIKGGFVTRSGLGDGAYDGTIWKERGKAVAVEIVFLTDES